jgi:hypothetical protein
MAGPPGTVICVCFSILTLAKQSNPVIPKHDPSNAYAARPGGHRKVLAVEAAVKEQARRLAAVG